jgi:geranylgeranyl pyrophosphate synthase
LAGASAIIAEGEVMQLKSANNLAATEEHYLDVVSAKTAALFAAAAESGAVLAAQGEAFVGALKDYGNNLGIAFQLVDDALDYSGRQALMGKTVGDDFREAKMTAPSPWSNRPAPSRKPCAAPAPMPTGPRRRWRCCPMATFTTPCRTLPISASNAPIRRGP